MTFSLLFCKRSVAILCLAWAFLVPAPADSGPELSCALSLPLTADTVTPSWLGHPTALPGNFAVLDLPVTVPAAGESLLVTLTFAEKDGGFLRISWRNGLGEQVLSQNFYEGVAMDNQRILLVPAAMLQKGGTLRLQASSAELGVKQIALEWLTERLALVSPDQSDEQVISRLGTTSGVSTLDGDPPQAVNPSLDGSLVTVPITATPQRIEQGVAVGLQLQSVPRAARLSLNEAGLPWTSHLVLWINSQRAGTITPEVPDLADVGFSSGGAQPYVGWRRGSIYLPVGLLRTGVNTLQFSVETDAAELPDLSSDDATAAQPLALKDLVCQFDYAAPPVGVASPTPAPATAILPPATEATGELKNLPALTLRTPTDETIATPGASAALPLPTTNDSTGLIDPPATIP